MPLTADDVSAQAFDADGDGRPQNALGFFYTDLLTLGVAVGPQFEGRIQAGQLLWVFEVQLCEDSALDHARVLLHQGADADGNPNNNLEVDTELEIVEEGPVAAVGTVSGSSVVAAEGLGLAPVAPMFDSDGTEPLEFSAVDGVSIELSLSDESVSGVLGICQETSAARESIAEPASRGLSSVLTSDTGCPTSCETENGQDVEVLFDADEDGVVTPLELLDNLTYRLKVDEDSDLSSEFEGAIVYWPLADGTKDHSSLGLRFRAVRVDVAGSR